MIDKFLSAKHWHLFIPLFVIPLLLQMVMMRKIFSSMINFTQNAGPDLSNFGPLISITMLILFLCVLTFFGWIWSIGIGLRSKIPNHIRMKTGLFKVSIIYPLIYSAAFFLLIPVLFQSLGSLIIENFNPAYISIVLFFHFFAIISVIYSLYFAAKTIKTAELQKEVGFSDLLAEFVFLWIYPAGVWILQPEINRLHGIELDDDIDQYLVK